ncbi:MAG: hypothetical protein ABH824_02430 [Nanoarchaeota archaeon]|nr:hypothetical protein [Nanoarchaeota archaeon]MBU1632144.1 hypothetical protein [Nanoarchaeota archaeon]MBU1876345.1 hypothetical protein [Nanoarchaeota archaeon]
MIHIKGSDNEYKISLGSKDPETTLSVINKDILKFIKKLNGEEEEESFAYIHEAAKIAEYSSCLRSKCGSVIVNGNKIIGKGFNSPPLNKTIDHCFKDNLPEDFKSDKTCCVHAEQRAVMDALRNNPEEIADSRIYFIRLDQYGSVKKSGQPYCTICSKLVLDVGIAEFALWHDDGIYVYNTEEYNRLSFQFRSSNIIK